MSLVWTLVPIVPALQILSPVATVIGERLLYIPVLGISMLFAEVVCGVGAGVSGRSSRQPGGDHTAKQKARKGRKDKNSEYRKNEVKGDEHGETSMSLVRAACTLFVLTLCAARCMARNEDWRSSDTLFRSTLSSCPDGVKALIEVSKIELRKGNVTGHVALLERATQIIPSNPDAHFMLGASKMDRGEYEPAERHLRIADENKGTFQPALARLGRLLAASTPPRTEEARNVLRRCVTEGPAFAECHALYADVLVISGESQALAIEHYERAIALGTCTW